MMKNYEISVQVVARYTVQVEAKNAEHAKEMVDHAYSEGNMVEQYEEDDLTILDIEELKEE